MDSAVFKQCMSEALKSRAEFLLTLDKHFLDEIGKICELMYSCIKRDGLVMWCGNGGSASDCMHYSAELVCRFKNDRRAVRSIALSSDTAAITSISNDQGYTELFARQVEALGRSNDLLIAISTSGASENVLRAIEFCEDKGIATIAVTGKRGLSRGFKNTVNICLPSTDTAEIQEACMTAFHVIIGYIESMLLGKP